VRRRSGSFVTDCEENDGMTKLRFTRLLLAGCVSLTALDAAVAGGLERAGHNVDLLFDTSAFVGETAYSFVMPQRELDDVVDINPLNGNLNNRPNQGIADTENYVVPRIGFKARLGEPVDCMVDYSQPWGSHTHPGLNWAGANSNIETKIESDGFGATCSYKADVGRGQARLIGGVFYHEIGGFKDRLVAELPPILPFSGVGHLALDGDGVGWRIGAAYEIPEIAFRASLVYNSEIELDRITGVLDLTQVPRIPTIPALNNPLLGRVTPVFGSAALPQSVELKAQSGVAPGWLVFGALKWVDWSVLQSLPFCPIGTEAVPCVAGGPTQATSLELLYQDGWTVTAGVGHAFSSAWSGALSLTWDRGTSTTQGINRDTWTLVGGVSFTPDESFELRSGVALGVLTSGSSTDSHATYSYGNDFVGAVSATAKLRF
jgi:long-chain fatty acid transport protein